MTVLFASDHAGYHLKGSLMPFVADLGHEVRDIGAFKYDSTDDYPDFVSVAAQEVSLQADLIRAIILGGSGQGEAIVANRYPHVRAVVWNGDSDGARRNELDEVTLSRSHNNANVLSIGARFVTEEEAKAAVRRWLTTPFSGDERHVRRLAKLEALVIPDHLDDQPIH